MGREKSVHSSGVSTGRGSTVCANFDMIRGSAGMRSVGF